MAGGVPAPLRPSLRRLPRGNGLTDDTWVALGLVEERIVTALLQQLRRDGVPAHCEWISTGLRIPPRPSRWCLWIGYCSYWRADEILGELVPRLLRQDSG
jgi:hypothetical protein